MNMRKGIMALEGLEIIDEAEDVSGLDEDVQAIDELDAEIDESCEQHDEALEIGDSVDALADNVEASIEEVPGVDGAEATPGEGIGEGEAEILDIAVEHFRKRLGYNKKVMPALEGFATPDGALVQSKVALENLRELSKRLDARLVISQEGIFDSITTSVGMLFQTEDKVLAKLRQVSLAYDGKTVGTEPIVDPGWGKYLKSDKPAYSGADGIAALATIEKTAGNAAIKSHVDTLAECLQKLSKEVKGNWFVSNKNDIARIEAIQATVAKEIEGLASLTELVTKNKTTSFAPVTAQEKAKLVASITAVLGDKSLSAELKNLFSKSGALSSWAAWNTQFRLKGMAGGMVAGNAGMLIAGSQAEDIKKANITNRQVYKAVKAVKDIVSAKVKVCSALVSYIEASAS